MQECEASTTTATPRAPARARRQPGRTILADQTESKPLAKVLAQVDGKPFIVAGEYGPKKARIVCILGAPMGAPTKGQIPFWHGSGVLSRPPGWPR